MSTRRQLLAVAAVTASGAGCLGALGSDEDPDSDSDSDSGADRDVPDGAVELGELQVQNDHDDDHRVQLALEADGEVGLLEVHDLDAGTSATIVDRFEEPASEFRLSVRLDDEEIERAELTDGVREDADCVRALVRIESDGGLGIWNGACD